MNIKPKRVFGPWCIRELSLDCFSGLWWEHSPPSQHCWLTELLEACQILSHHLTKEVYRARTPARVCTFFQLQESCQQTLTLWHETKMALLTDALLLLLIHQLVLVLKIHTYQTESTERNPNIWQSNNASKERFCFSKSMCIVLI